MLQTWAYCSIGCVSSFNMPVLLQVRCKINEFGTERPIGAQMNQSDLVQPSFFMINSTNAGKRWKISGFRLFLGLRYRALKMIGHSINFCENSKVVSNFQKSSQSVHLEIFYDRQLATVVLLFPQTQFLVIYI